MQTNDIIKNLVDNEFENQLMDISINGSKLWLSNFTDKDYILDLKNKSLITGQSECKSYTSEFKKRFYVIDDNRYVFDKFCEDLSAEDYTNKDDLNFYNTENKLIDGPLISDDNKKIVSVEKDVNNHYYFVFYDIDKRTIMKGSINRNKHR
ncbi:hypothetical protein [Lutispora sp.]|uniref:hypothetical protein n=1 Tax=Lutispora sp. TaxID=2828727 RepID=UPI00356698BE